MGGDFIFGIRTYKNLHRLRHIVTILIRHGFGHLIERLNLRPILSPARRIVGVKRKEKRATPSRRIRLALEELGPTFVKFGQVLSSRPDLIPADFYEELSRLQDRVTPFPYEEVKEIIERELGKPLDELFISFSETPFASASIAQAHKARLKTGEDVVVKVERPGIKEIISRDCSILMQLARLAERYIPETRSYNPVGLVKEFSHIIQQELDFTIEAGHADKFRKNFEGDRTVFIPKVFWDLITPQVLTMEEVKGIKIKDFEALSRAGFDRRKLAFDGVNLFFRQIFDHGFFHADPHPGNIFVLEDGRLAFVDFGIVGRVSKAMLTSIARIFVAMVKHDTSALSHGFLSLGVSTKNVDLQSFERDVEELLDSYHNVPLKYIRAERFLNEMVGLSRKYHLTLPQDFVLLGKTVFIIGGLGRELYPEFNILEVAEPFARKLMLKRFESKEIASSLYKAGEEVLSFLTSLPGQWREIVSKLNRGEMKMEFEHKGLDNFMMELDRSSNRLAFSLIVAAIIIGSSLIIRMDTGPKIFSYPALGIVGYILAGVLGLWLIAAILRSGKL